MGFSPRFRWLLISFFLLLCRVLSACPNGHLTPPGGETALSGPEQGGGELTLDLPLPAGTDALCTQGANGATSHQYASTRYDLDLDTPNNASWEVYAPAAGVARVHTESADSGFGYHVNVDLGDGRYVVVAHLSRVLVGDGARVAVGQLIGLEGCTGACQGDHIHIGLHQGSAASKAGSGTSVPARYRVKDGGGTVRTLGSADFVCGIPGGAVYRSLLSVPRFHPDGALVKTAHDSKVYLIQNGERRWIVNETIFASYKFSFGNVMTIADEELACYEPGPDISAPTTLEVVRESGSDRWWLLVGTPGWANSYRVKIHEIARAEVIASWGLPYDDLHLPPQRASVELQNLPVQSGFALFRDGALVAQAGDPTLYVASHGVLVALENETVENLLGYGSRPVIETDSGEASEIQAWVGDCEIGVFCLDRATAATCGAGLDLETPDEPPTPDDPQDSDGDGVSDDQDNCDNAWNPAQDDLDNDGLGDVCDSDKDGDGVSGSADCNDYNAAVGDCSDPDPEDSEDPTPEVPEDPEGPDPEDAFLYCGSGQAICLQDASNNVTPEQLCLIDDNFTEGPEFQHASAWALGNGLFGWSVPSRLVSPSDGYFCVDFTGMPACGDVELTLVSSDLDVAGNQVWWQNEALCTSGTWVDDLYCTNTGGGNYLISVSWDPVSGLIPNGDESPY